MRKGYSEAMRAVDFYYHEAYASLYLEKDEEVIKFTIDNEYGKLLHLFIKRPIPEKYGCDDCYDITTPYGYGGPIIIESEDKDRLVEEFSREFEAYCSQNSIVSEFVRFHPLYENHSDFKDFYDVVKNRDTIYVDLSSEDAIWNNMKHQSRTRIRHALDSNIEVAQDNTEKGMDKFIELYYMTMDKNNADECYYFDKDYFYNLMTINSSVKIFNAVYENEIIASTVILLGDEYMHCHLAATNPEFYELSPNNLLLYEVSKWGCANGYSKLHLGGGRCASDDYLFRFKKSMNKNGVTEFYIGTKIYDNDRYEQLVEARENEVDFNADVDYFPRYRG